MEQKNSNIRTLEVFQKYVNARFDKMPSSAIAVLSIPSARYLINRLIDDAIKEIEKGEKKWLVQ